MKQTRIFHRWAWLLLAVLLVAVVTACDAKKSAAAPAQDDAEVSRQETVPAAETVPNGENAGPSVAAEPVPTGFGVVYNGFAAAGDDGWIYYRGGSSNQYSLKKMRPDGSDVTVVLNNRNPWYINVADGWVYYSSARGSIYKVRTDGTEETQLNDCASEYIDVADGWIYYSNRKEGTVNKMRTDGSEDTVLAKGSHSRYCDGWIYFSGEGYHTFRISVDGENMTDLLDHDADLAFDTEWIYFDRYSKKMRYDGSEITDTGENAGFIFAVMDGEIYYTNQDSLYRRKLGETEAVEVVGGEVSTFSLVGDWIIYYDSIQERMCMIPKDSVNGEGSIPA